MATAVVDTSPKVEPRWIEAAKVHPILSWASFFNFAAGVLALASGGAGWYTGRYYSATATMGDKSISGNLFVYVGGVWIVISCDEGQVCTPPDTALVAYSPGLGGAIITFVGATLLIVAVWTALTAAYNTRAVITKGKLPTAPATRGGECGGCYASMPAVNGVGWTGWALCMVGMVWLAIANSITAGIFSFTSAFTSYNTMGIASGGPLLGTALILSFIACVMTTVAGCRLRGMPGVGEDMGGCCSVAPQAAPGGAPQPQLAVVYAQPQPGVVYVAGAPPQTA